MEARKVESEESPEGLLRKALTRQASQFSSSRPSTHLTMRNTTTKVEKEEESISVRYHPHANTTTTTTTTTTDCSSNPVEPRVEIHGKHVVRNSLLAGSISGMTATAIMYPMDVLRTSMQASSMAGGRGGGMTGGPFQVLRQTMQLGGIRALYTGISLPLAAQAAFKATVFAVNNSLEQVLLDFKSNNRRNNDNDNHNAQQVVELSLADRMACGFVAGAMNGAIFVTPVEFVRNQMIVQQARLASSGGGVATNAVPTTWNVVRSAFQTKGIHSLWRGIGITILRDGIGVASFFAAMATTQQMLMKALYNHEGDPKQQQPPFWVRVAGGASAGLAYWVSSLPLDTIKTWIQSSDSSVRVSPVKVLGEIYLEHGAWGVVSRLNRGWQVAYGRGAPAAAITMSVYSTLYQMLQKYEE